MVARRAAVQIGTGFCWDAPNHLSPALTLRHVSNPSRIPKDHRYSRADTSRRVRDRRCNAAQAPTQPVSGRRGQLIQLSVGARRASRGQTWPTDSTQRSRGQTWPTDSTQCRAEQTWPTDTTNAAADSHGQASQRKRTDARDSEKMWPTDSTARQLRIATAK